MNRIASVPLNTAKLNHCLIYETIAITGVNVKRAFVYAARQAVLNHFKKLSGKSMEDTLLELNNRKEKGTDQHRYLTQKELKNLEKYDDYSNEGLLDKIREICNSEEIQEIIKYMLTSYELRLKAGELLRILETGKGFKGKRRNKMREYEKNKKIINIIKSIHLGEIDEENYLEWIDTLRDTQKSLLIHTDKTNADDYIMFFNTLTNEQMRSFETFKQKSKKK